MQKTNCIALAVSPGCTKQVHIMMYSVFCNNPNMAFDCYFLYFSIPDKELVFYKKMITKAGHRCIFLKFPKIRVARTEYKHVTNETFLRLLIPSALPKDVKRVLYLDFDIIVNGSLDKLFQDPFRQYSLLAVVANKDQRKLKDVKRTNGVPYGKKYFNAGVLVMNLDKLRKDEHFEKKFVLDYLENHLNDIMEDDQGYLNHFLWNKTRIINHRYNYNAAIYYCDGYDVYSRIQSVIKLMKEEKKAKKEAIIIHYRGASKPWNRKYNGQCSRLYLHYARNAGYSVKKSFYFSQKKAKLINLAVLLFKK